MQIGLNAFFGSVSETHLNLYLELECVTEEVNFNPDLDKKKRVLVCVCISGKLIIIFNLFVT